MAERPSTMAAGGLRKGKAEKGEARPLYRDTQIRLFLTCWLIFSIHFATDIVREHYLAFSLAEHASFRVDEYMGLHPDLFETPGRGAHVGNNPGASMIAAIPYFVFKPAINWVSGTYNRATRKPGQEVTAIYRHEDRPNRLRFYEQVRERGLDVKFGLASLVMTAFCMAPLSALAAVVMFRLLVLLGLARKLSLLMALLYALGTPIFFRTAYVNQNLMIAHFALFAFVLLWNPGGLSRWSLRQRYAAAGFFGGLTLLCDYSGAVVLLFLGGYAFAKRWDETSWGNSWKDSLWFAFGMVGPVALLLFYQWRSFGNPFWPGQHYMPPVEWIDIGYQGFGAPTAELFGLLFFDLRFGLFVTAPLLVLALFAPILSYRKKSLIPRRETIFILLFFAGLALFFSCVQYTRIQWVSGIRYMIPVIPFLFLLTVAVLIRIPRVITHGIAVLAFAESWCLSMVRPSGSPDNAVFDSVQQVLLQGFQLPWLTVVGKMASQYASFLLVSGPSPLALFALWSVLIYGIWRFHAPWATFAEDEVSPKH